MQYNLVVCGGTFDHFHSGHEAFLKHVFYVGKKIIIGITSDVYINKSKIKDQISKIESYRIRKDSVESFLKQNKLDGRAGIVKIDDIFGPTLDKDLEIDAIVASHDTKRGVDIINQKRKEAGLKPLEIIVAPFVIAEDGKIISSRRIRRGEISREGKLYINPLWLKKDLVLPENLRKEFKKPLGTLLRHSGKRSASRILAKIRDAGQASMTSSYVVTVGDVTTKLFNDLSLNQNISVIDFKVARQNKYSSVLELGFSGEEKIVNINNPAGNITSELFSATKVLFDSNKERIILKINGEEDLAVLPLILVAPLNSVIYYGQPDLGLIKVDVSEAIKVKAYSLVNKLEYV